MGPSGQGQGFNGQGFLTPNQGMANPQQFPGPSGSNTGWQQQANPQQMPAPNISQGPDRNIGPDRQPNPYGFVNHAGYMGPDPSQILGTGGGLGAYIKNFGNPPQPLIGGIKPERGGITPLPSQPSLGMGLLPQFGGTRMNFPPPANPGERLPWTVPGGPPRGGGNNQILPMPFNPTY